MAALGDITANIFDKSDGATPRPHYKITGTVKYEGVGSQQRVVLLDPTDFSMIRQGYSAPNGSLAFDGIVGEFLPDTVLASVVCAPIPNLPDQGV